MICPYCNARNVPNSPICTHCGVILRDVKIAKRPVERNLRPFFLNAIAYILVGLATGALAFFLAGHLKDSTRTHELVAGGIGMAAGILIVFIVSAGRIFVYTLLYRSRLNKVTAQIKMRHAKASKRIDEILKKQPSAEAHLDLAISHLLDNENDQSLTQFEQALRLGMNSVEFQNDYGIAMARKGHLDAALDRFARAADSAPDEPTPKVNLATALIQTRDRVRIAEAVGLLRSATRGRENDAILMGRLGRAMIENGDSATAISILRKATDAGGRDFAADSHNLNGLTLLAANKLKEAGDAFRAALTSEPGHGHAMANQGVVFLRQKKTLDAVERLRTAIDVDPNAAKTRCDFGCALILDNSLNEGIREIREATVLDPLLVEAHFNLGKIYADHSIYTHAERYFTTCLKINPRMWEAAAGMGLIHYFVGPVERAIAWYQEADKISPDQPIVLGGLALCAALSNDYYTAEQNFTRAVELDPKNAASLANYGWLQIQKQNVELASKFIERAVTNDKYMPSALNNMALCNIEMGANDLALKNFKRALEINPDMVQVHYNLGHVSMLDKDMNGAIREWDLAAKLESNNPDVHANLGVANYQRKRFDLAVDNFKNAVRIRQDRMEDYANYGLSLSRNGQHEESIEQFDKAVAMDPKNAMLHSNRGLACYFAKRVEEAMVEWRVVSQINAAYARTRGKKQQSEFDEASMEFIPLYITERAVHAVPASSDFLYAVLPGYGIDTYEPIIADEDLKDIPQYRAQQAKLQRALKSLKL